MMTEPSNYRFVNLSGFHSEGDVQIVRYRDGKRFESTYNPLPRSLYRLEAVIGKGSPDIQITGGALDVSVYFRGQVRLSEMEIDFLRRRPNHGA